MGYPSCRVSLIHSRLVADFSFCLIRRRSAGVANRSAALSPVDPVQRS
jgi:hypothetical protein